MIDEVTDLHNHSIRLIKSQLDALEKATKDRGYDEDLAAMAANLARSVATLTAETRKRETHGKKVVDNMPVDERDALVLAYIAEMSKERRAAVRAYLQELEAQERSIL